LSAQAVPELAQASCFDRRLQKIRYHEGAKGHPKMASGAFSMFLTSKTGPAMNILVIDGYGRRPGRERMEKHA